MSPQLSFDTAAKGQVPETGAPPAGKLMGRELSAAASLAALETIGHGIGHGRVDLTDAAVAGAKADAKSDLAKNFQRATPGGGLAPKGDESVEYKYDPERNADIGRVAFSLK